MSTHDAAGAPAGQTGVRDCGCGALAQDGRRCDKHAREALASGERRKGTGVIVSSDRFDIWQAAFSVLRAVRAAMVPATTGNGNATMYISAEGPEVERWAAIIDALEGETSDPRTPSAPPQETVGQTGERLEWEPCRLCDSAGGHWRAPSAPVAPASSEQLRDAIFKVVLRWLSPTDIAGSLTDEIVATLNLLGAAPVADTVQQFNQYLREHHPDAPVADAGRQGTPNPEGDTMHHSSNLDEALRKALGTHRERLGATGQFPEGKLTPEDEGEIKLAIGERDGKVVIDFGKPVVWIGFSKEQARDIAALLLQHAQDS